ncbi:MAG: DUF2157 domain-containing protein [bacterium]
MSVLEDFLARWLKAELIDEGTAERLRQFESSGPLAAQSTADRPGALEALLYLGLVVLGVGVFSLMGLQWDEFSPAGRVAAIATPTALLLLMGWVLRRSTDPEFRRGSQAAWLVAVAFFAGTIAVVLSEYTEAGDNDSGLLIVSGGALALSFALWLFNRSPAQVLAIAATSFFFGQATGTLPDEWSQEVAGSTVLCAGLAGVVLAEMGLFRPASTARGLFALLVLAGPYEAGVGNGPLVFELLAGLAAVAVIGLGVRRGDFPLLLIGVAGAFVVLVTFIFEHFSDQLGAPLALVLCGAILVGGVLLLGALRRSSGVFRRA